MAIVYKDRVRETTTTSGTGAVSLLGALTGFQSFGSVLTDGAVCPICIADRGGSNWEVSQATYSASANTLIRTTILASSNSGSAVNFGSNVKDVFLTLPAELITNSSPITLTAHNTTETPLTINGATGQTADLLDVNGVSTFAITPTASANISTITVNNNPNPSADASGNTYTCITCNSVPQSNFHIQLVYGVNVTIFGFNQAKVDSTYGGSFSSGISATNVAPGTLQGDNIFGVLASGGHNGSGLVTNIYGLEAVASVSGGSGSTATNLYSVYALLSIGGSTTVTNAYGVYVPAPAGTPTHATNLYGVYVSYMGAGNHAITTVDASNNVLFDVRASGTVKPAHLADSTAENDSIYYSTTAGKLAYKDPSGVVHPLY